LPSKVKIDCQFNLFPGEALKMTAADIEAVSNNEAVEQIWPDLPVQAWLNVSVPKIVAPQVWEAGFKGKGIKLGIIDTGIDNTHPDFTNRIIAMKSFVDDTPIDENGHGTHVAGIAAGSGAKSKWKICGGCPRSRVVCSQSTRC